MEKCLSCLEAEATESGWGTKTGPVLCKDCYQYLYGGTHMGRFNCTKDRGYPCYEDTCVDCWGEEVVNAGVQKQTATATDTNVCMVCGSDNVRVWMHTKKYCSDCYTKHIEESKANPTYYIRKPGLLSCCIKFIPKYLQERRDKKEPEPLNGHRMFCPQCKGGIVLENETWRYSHVR